jgi:DNA repair exonuclease SbcCD ATPase subunit
MWKVQSLKDQINTENAITVEKVTEIARDREVERLKRIVDNNKQLSKHIDHYSTVLANLENSIESMAQRKPEARSELQLFTKEAASLLTRIQ